MSEADESPEVEDITRFSFLRERANQFQSIAGDAKSWLRTNFLIIGFFLPIIGSLFSGQLSPEKVFNNAYTQVGLIVWVLSTLLFSFIYHRARVVAKTHFDPVEAEMLGEIPENERRYRIQDTIDEYSSSVGSLNLFISGCTLLTLIATTLFALGVLLPYVSVIPQFNTLVIVGAVLGTAVLTACGYKIRGYLPNVSQLLFRNTTGWNDLTKPRQDLMKKIYVAVGTDPFQLSDLPLKHETPMYSGTLSSSSIDESHILLRDVSDNNVSEYLLEQMVDEGYFEKAGNTDATTIKPPHTYEEFTIDEIEDEVETAIDRLGRELDSNADGREVAAEELSLRPDEVLEELRVGDELDRIKRYNRVVERLREEDFDLASRPFEFTSDEVTYVPTELAEQAYEKIEMEERTREYDREVAERQEQARRAENTIRYRVVEPADEFGEIQIVTHDISVPESYHEWLSLPEADITPEEREQLQELEAGDEIQLRTETHPRSGEDHIVSVGPPSSS
ncbi:hypothetical protein [Natronococcus wangiae]|uniref:hypothetical protein n=1 Tax=Natronococcus wangiae TaxID=3068275 RepID=UPI00273FD817|nr:hypothetical protein [Natronococcus sp. AD5]